jgi:hypothetical protein
VTVRLTEGELKVDTAMVLSDVPTISAPGVASWRPAIDAAKSLGVSTIRLAFDADAAEKSTVARALAAAAEGLAAEGFAVEVERWDSMHKGIDDALAAGVAVEVLAGDAARAHVAEALTTATAGKPPPPPNPLDRLGDVLANGGAEGLFRDKGLLQSLAQLAEMDPTEFVCCRARLKTAGIALRDFHRARAPHRQAILAERPPLTSAGEYRIAGGRTVRVPHTKDGPVEDVLCNFTARIVEQVTADDGAEKSTRLAVEGELCDGTPLPRVEIPAEKFAWMDWTIPAWGSKAVVVAGANTKDYVRCAIQSLSGDPPQRTVFTHLGWRRLGDRWAYLHAGGAVWADGPVDGVVGESAPRPIGAALARRQGMVHTARSGRLARHESHIHSNGRPPASARGRWARQETAVPACDHPGAATSALPWGERRDNESIPGACQGVLPLVGQGPSHR